MKYLRGHAWLPELTGVTRRAGKRLELVAVRTENWLDSVAFELQLSRTATPPMGEMP